ncbi:AAA family ATPase [Jonesia quinghaiensis]|uniref:AAA family ATPase n=1 Tax=Jonesia quinghaiensis TaxID=262806 RepID=UPI0004019398|nr:AAA family ATPase [Jonesia quinghaiensis]
MLETQRARGLWVRAMKVRQADSERAVRLFEKAVQIDPTMADAWLGLHVAGKRCDEELSAMVLNEKFFGAERNRHKLPLQSRYELVQDILMYRLETHHDLWCAIASRHIDNGDLNEAQAALRRVEADSETARLLHARLSLLKGERDEALRMFRFQFSGDPYMETYARLMSATVLISEGVLAPATEHLTWVLNCNAITALHAEAKYYLGVIAESQGDSDRAKMLYHEAYAENPLQMFKSAIERFRDDVVSTFAEEAQKELTRVEARRNSGAERLDDLTEEDAETTGDVLAELDRQIGQEQVKRQVRKVLAQTKAQAARQRAGLSSEAFSEHFVFTGPPGTGKTTIARMIGRLYCSLGVLEKGHIVEATRADLIGQYHGHTTAQTSEIIDRALGGILFIDEAYSLQTEGFMHGDPFGMEAIDTLLKRMEDDRSRLVVIVAGYQEPMHKFLDSNPGLRSRFTTTIEFHPYTVPELLEIAQLMAGDSDNKLRSSALSELDEYLQGVEESGGFHSPSFGHARAVRSIVAESAAQRNLRIFGDNDGDDLEAEDLSTITGEDIREAVAIQARGR